MKTETVVLKFFQLGALGLVFFQPLPAALSLLCLAGLEFGMGFLAEQAEHRKKVEDPAVAELKETVAKLQTALVTTQAEVKKMSQAVSYNLDNPYMIRK